jgi:hypothetical protein
MGVTEVDLGGWAPGKGDILLERETIDSIQVDYGVGNCVEISSFLPGRGIAGDVKVGQSLLLADEKTLEAGEGRVTYSESKSAFGFRIVTAGGASLLCSSTAPIPTPDGLVKASDLLGKQVAVRYGDEVTSKIGWELVVEVIDVGQIKVQHITVGDKCFWAGQTKGAYILHHNLKNAGGGGGDDPYDPWYWASHAPLPGTDNPAALVGIPPALPIM